jgi:glycosyltransferase involved in cell wall biosynthesis
MMPKILFFAEKGVGSDSGVIAAREGARIFSKIGCDVAYCAPGALSFNFPEMQRIYYIRPHRQLNHLVSSPALNEFCSVLDDFKPTHVFYFGSAISKTASFLRAAHKRGVRQIGFWITPDFFCTGNYGCLRSGPCKLCIDGSYYQAILHKCSYHNGNLAIPKTLFQTILRVRLGRELRKCDVVMGSSRHQLSLFEEFGYDRSRAVHCPLFFDKKRVEGLKPHLGDYFVLYGQTRFEKGWHLFKDTADRCRGVKFVLPFASKAVGELAIKNYCLSTLVDSGQVAPVYNVTWDTGVKEIVAASRGVLIPSIWPTTTEYTLLESLGLGKPIVAFDVGIHHEEIQDGVNGLLAPLNDIENLASKIMLIYSDDKLACGLGRGARELFDYLVDNKRIEQACKSALNLTS